MAIYRVTWECSEQIEASCADEAFRTFQELLKTGFFYPLRGAIEIEEITLAYSNDYEEYS